MSCLLSNITYNNNMTTEFLSTRRYYYYYSLPYVMVFVLCALCNESYDKCSSSK